MKKTLVILLVALGCCSTLASTWPKAEQILERQISSAANLFYSIYGPNFLHTIDSPHHRVARSLLKSLDSKKSSLLKGRKKSRTAIIKQAAQCCSLADTGEYIRPEIAEKIINGLDDDEKLALDKLLRNNTGPLTLADLLADLSKDESELNFPEDVQLTNKAVVEALLSKNVLLKYPLTDDNGICIDDQRALISAFKRGNLKFPLRDKFGSVLRDITDALPAGSKEVLGTLLGGNVVSDILESGALGLLKYPIKDAKGIPVLDRGFLLFLVAQGGFKKLKFPMINAYGLELSDDTDLLLILIDGGFLKNLVYPVKDSNGVVIKNKLALVKAIREGLAFKGLKYPIMDCFGITIKRPDALMGALLDDDAARAVGFPLTDAQGALIKDKLQLFLTLLDGGLDLVTFPLRDAEGNYFKDKLAFLIAIIEALREKQGLDVLLQRSVASISKFPLTDNAGHTINDNNDLLAGLFDSQALAGLNFPLSDMDGHVIPNKEAFLLDLLNNGFKSLELPLTNKKGASFYSPLDLVDVLIDGSALMGLNFPLKDKMCRLIKDKEALLHHIFKNDLRFPLTDCQHKEIKDFAELISLLLDADALENLKFPLFDSAVGIFKNKADFLGALLKGGLEALDFPLKDVKGGVLPKLENLLENLFNNSVLSELVFPVKDLSGLVFNNKLDLLDSLLGGVLGLSNLDLPEVLSGTIKDVESLLESLLGNLDLLNFPLTDILGGSVNNTSDLMDKMLKTATGLKGIKFPLTDRTGLVIKDKHDLLATLRDVNALNSLRFPLVDCVGTVYKNKCDFLRRLLKGINSLNFPLTDGSGHNLPDGKSLLEVLLQALITLLKPVLIPLAEVLAPVASIIEGLLGGNLTIIESLLTQNSSSSNSLRYPLMDASGRNITNQLELYENLLDGGLRALKFPLMDSTGKVLNNKIDFLKQLLRAGPLANLEFPLRDRDGIFCENEISLLIAISNNNLKNQEFPLTDRNGFIITSKLELLIKLFDKKALCSFQYPLIDGNSYVINNQHVLIETLVDGGLSSFKYPIFDSGDRVLKDKFALCEILGDKFLPPKSLIEQQTSKPKTGVLRGILNLLKDETSLGGDELALLKAIKEGVINEKDLKKLLGNDKFSILKDKLDKADNGNAADSLQLTKILDAILGLLIKKKPEIITKMQKDTKECSFT